MSGMALRIVLLAAVLLVASARAIGGSPFTSLHPEEAHPDPKVPVQSDPYAGLISRVQERLLALGFAAGPVNGDFGEKTQAALAQFQLSASIPASGSLDDRTLAELGVERDQQAAAGATSKPAQ
jgi:peptidoglycan hydrolase-like protein with peptidoglycan-binding domain